MKDFVRSIKEVANESLKEAVLSVLGVIGSFLMPAAMILLAVVAVVILDTVFGWYKYKKTPKGATSRGARIGFGKKVMAYCSIIIVLYIVDFALINEVVKQFVNIEWAATKLVAAVLIWFELTSINENFRAITGKSFMQVFKHMINTMKGVKEDVKDLKE